MEPGGHGDSGSRTLLYIECPLEKFVRFIMEVGSGNLEELRL